MPHRPLRGLATALLCASVLATLVGLAPAAPAAAAPVVLDDGHVDALSPRLEGSRFVLEVKDDTGSVPAYRSPGDVLFHVVPDAAATVPDDPRFTDLLGPAGTPIWIVPEVQKPGVVWAGWSTERLPNGSLAGNAVDIVLHDVQGPGELVVFASSAFGDPMVRFNTRDGLPDTRAEPVGSHVHANWVFDAEGTYSLTFEVTGTLPNGNRVSSGLETYTFAVGELPADPGPSPTEALVEDLYRVVLDRAPSQADLDYWVGRIEGGGSPAHLAESLARTREGYAQVVRWAYATALGRAPEPGGLTYWTDRLQASRRPDTLVTQLFASPEAWILGGSTSRGWVGFTYGRLLGRSPDAGGHDYWTSELDMGGATPATRARISGVFLRTLEVSRAAVATAATVASGSPALPAAQRDALVLGSRTSAQHPSVLRAAVVIGGCPTP